MSQRIASDWIRPLAMPYLRGYRAVTEPGKELNGWWFSASRGKQPVPRRTGFPPIAGVSGAMVGFFAGYLLGEARCSFLAPQVPECLIFATIQPVGGPEHNRLVVEPNSLLRRTFEYIRWLTHRPPRFAFYENEPLTLVRHTSMREWPRPKYRHYSRNFFIETFAWLVRSGLVRRLLEKPGVDQPPRGRIPLGRGLPLELDGGPERDRAAGEGAKRG